MAPPYGVDTQTSRLDSILWPAFLAWNGDTGPVLAGRNFLGDGFIWVSLEATTALAKPARVVPTRSRPAANGHGALESCDP